MLLRDPLVQVLALKLGKLASEQPGIAHVPFAFPATFGITKLLSDLFRKNTQVERQIVSSFTMEPIRPRLIVRILLRVLRLAEAKKTVVGVIGNAIRQVGSSSGIPHG